MSPCVTSQQKQKTTFQKDSLVDLHKSPFTKKLGKISWYLKVSFSPILIIICKDGSVSHRQKKMLAEAGLKGTQMRISQ